MAEINDFTASTLDALMDKDAKEEEESRKKSQIDINKLREDVAANKAIAAQVPCMPAGVGAAGCGTHAVRDPCTYHAALMLGRSVHSSNLYSINMYFIDLIMLIIFVFPTMIVICFTL